MTTEEEIKNAFDPYFNAPLEAWKAFVQLGEVIYSSKDQVLKKSGDTERYLYFILSGSGGIVLWNNNNFVCIDLCYEAEFFGDYMSFITGKATPLEVITFEPSKLFRLSKNNFNRLSHNSQWGEKICRFAAEALFIHKQNQQIEISCKTALERYHDLQLKQAQIIQRTPQKYTASYLGITPQSLSRIRKELAQKN